MVCTMRTMPIPLGVSRDSNPCASNRSPIPYHCGLCLMLYTNFKHRLCKLWDHTLLFARASLFRRARRMLALTALTTGSTTPLQTAETTRKPIAELKGAALLWDCMDIPGELTNAKGCIFRGLNFAGDPSRISDHLEVTGKHAKVCKPGIIWLQRHKEVVAELRRRAQNAQQEADLKARKESARLLVSSPTIMNTFGKPTNEPLF